MRTRLEAVFGTVGADVEVRPPFTIDYGSNISIGERTYIGAQLTALDVAPISIGADCQIGPNVQLLTPIYPLEPGARRTGRESAEPISIGDNVWLGGGVTICPGVTIGNDAVIGAGAVVTEDVPAGALAAGVPARVIRQLG
ncbi:sugar O-acetyltransferase [Brevibacterium luteolum]|nr:sugar O-acetyltransferase [Brevibacterium luteolum]